MALTRLNAFATGSIVTNSIITGEFDNIYNNALTLISPLAADLAAGGFKITGLSAGSLASPSLQFTSDANTGIYSPAAEQVAIVCAGAAAATFTTGAAGPHAIGGGANTRDGLLLAGTSTLAGATQEAGFGNTQALTNASGVNLYGEYLAPTLTNVAGATTTMAWLTIAPSALTITAGSVTNAAGLYITAAPTGATNNYALWVAGVSTSRFDGPLYFASGTAPSTAGSQYGGSATLLEAVVGTTGMRWLNNAYTVERMRLTDGGILLLGTTVTTNASAGDLVLLNSTGDILGVNAAGTNTVAMMNVNTSDRVSVDKNGNGVQFGLALIALGGGTAPTLGTIGGSGPATAGQNTWMQFYDSAGAAFWVPVWK